MSNKEEDPWPISASIIYLTRVAEECLKAVKKAAKLKSQKGLRCSKQTTQTSTGQSSESELSKFKIYFEQVPHSGLGLKKVRGGGYVKARSQ